MAVASAASGEKRKAPSLALSPTEYKIIETVQNLSLYNAE